MSSNSADDIQEMCLSGPGIVELRRMNACSRPVDLWEYQNTTMELPGDYTIVCVLCNCQIWIKMEWETLPVRNIKQHFLGNHHKQVVRDKKKDSPMEIVCYCSHHYGVEDQDSEDEQVVTNSSFKHLGVSEPNTDTKKSKKELEEYYGRIDYVTFKARGDGPTDTKKSQLSASGSGRMICTISQNTAEEVNKKPLLNERNQCLGVFGLNKFTTEEQLERRFGKFGKIEKVKLVRDGRGNSKCFAFLYFWSAEDATKAKEAMDCVVMDDWKIKVDYSVTTDGGILSIFTPKTVGGTGYQGHARRSRKWGSYSYRSKNMSRRSRGYGS